MDEKRETVVVSGGSGGAGWFVAVVLVVAVVIGGIYLVNTVAFNGTKDINIELKVPEVPKTN